MFPMNAHSAIVIHKTGGDPTPERVLQTFLASAHDPVPANRNRSVHYAVGQDGRIFQFVPEQLGAGGNGGVEPGFDRFWEPFLHTFGNLNLCTLSVEHCDPRKDNGSDLTPEQKAASFKLIAHLAQKFSIPLTNIKTHASIDPINRARCPGNYPLDELLQFLQSGGLAMGVPAGWHDDGTTLTASNGQKVVLGFRKRVLDGWDPNNVPLEGEHGQDPLEQFSPQADNKGTQQTFLFSVLSFTPTRGAFVTRIGSEFLGIRNEVKQLSDQVAHLENQIAHLQKTDGS
jgi:N-acetylmuramoyl-L-alanine amidase